MRYLLTSVESTPQYSAIPPQTPQSILSFSLLYNFFMITVLSVFMYLIYVLVFTGLCFLMVHTINR